MKHGYRASRAICSCHPCFIRVDPWLRNASRAAHANREPAMQKNLSVIHGLVHGHHRGLDVAAKPDLAAAAPGQRQAKKDDPKKKEEDAQKKDDAKKNGDKESKPPPVAEVKPDPKQGTRRRSRPRNRALREPRTYTLGGDSHLEAVVTEPRPACRSSPSTVSRQPTTSASRLDTSSS